MGVGYRASLITPKSSTSSSQSVVQQQASSPPIVSLKLGHSHPVELPLPEGVEVRIPAPQRLILTGSDLNVVTQFAAKIRAWRPPEPYNQKGVFVGDETIKKKVLFITLLLFIIYFIYGYCQNANSFINY